MIDFLSDPNAFSRFESTYLQLREKEGRILNDEQVRKLPYVSGLGKQLDAEWRFRASSFERLSKYFSRSKEGTRLLDIGCGNGWAAARLADNKRLELFAVDVNRVELEQADRVFSKPNLKFIFGDIFSDLFEPGSFDVITMNACLQYFNDMDSLFSQLFYFLKKGGEIHIIDTPIYDQSEISAARQRSEEYYGRMGFPEMAENYFHHSWEELKPYAPQPMAPVSLLEKMGLKKQTGLHWIRINKR